MPTTTTKLDMKTELTPLYAPRTHPVLVEVPELRYLMVDGVIPESSSGPGADPAFREAIAALYAVTYTLKFESKASDRDFVVMPLEGLFWGEGAEDTRPSGSGPIRWTAMIVQPPWITPERMGDAVATLVQKGRLSPLPALRLDVLAEGRAAQILHVGPYAKERPTIDRLHGFITERGLEARGKHHEIYLSDPNRTPAERLKTLIRQPVQETDR